MEAHINEQDYEPASKSICKIDTNRLSESYREGIKPGSSREQVLNSLPSNCSAVMLHYEKLSRNGKYGHATCLKQEQDTWWHIDSKNNNPIALTTNTDWAQLYGKIHVIKKGIPLMTAGDIELAWEGLDRDPAHAIGNHGVNATDTNRAWQAARNQVRHHPRAHGRDQPGSNAGRQQPLLLQPTTTATAALPLDAPPASGTGARTRVTPATTRPPTTSAASRKDAGSKRIQATLDKFLALARTKKQGQACPKEDDTNTNTNTHAHTQPPDPPPTAPAGTQGPVLPIEPSRNSRGAPPLDGAVGTAAGLTPPAPPPADESTGSTGRQQAMRNNTLSLMHYTLSTGLCKGMDDLNMLLHKYDPDMLTLAETCVKPKQLKSRWLHATLSGYKVFGSLAPEGREVQAIMAVKEHIANLGEAVRTPEITAEEGMGRLVSVRLNLPRTNPLTLSALYAPAGDSPEEQQQRGALYATLGKMMQGTHIVVEDMNAALLPTPRKAPPARTRHTLLSSPHTSSPAPTHM